MSFLAGLSSLFGVVTKPLADFLTVRQQAKANAESAKAKIAMAKQDGETQLQLSAAEWEAISKQNEAGSWKDEYVTLVITSPFVLLFISSVISAWTGDARYVDAVSAGIDSLKGLGVDMGELMTIVVFAAVSIKGVERLKK